jgi:hypothetical protein
MRMRADVDPLPGQKLGRAELLEEDERTDHLPLGRGQGTPHPEAAEVAGAGDDDGLDRIDGIADRDCRVEGGIPAHGVPSVPGTATPGANCACVMPLRRG